MRSSRSNTVTRCPARFNCCAAASPAGPEPMTATRLPVRRRRQLRRDPALVERVLDDRQLDALDRDRIVVDARARTTPRTAPGTAGRSTPGSCWSRAADRSPSASGCGRRGRSSPESGCRAGTPDGRTGCCSPCSGRPARARSAPRPADRPPASPAVAPRRAGPSPWRDRISRKPVILPMRHPDQFLECRLAILGPRTGLGVEHALVVARHDLHETRHRSRPSPRATAAACALPV